jgi:hypothetical protein
MSGDMKPETVGNVLIFLARKKHIFGDKVQTKVLKIGQHEPH